MKKILISWALLGATLVNAQSGYVNPQGANPDFAQQTHEVLTEWKGGVYVWTLDNNGKWAPIGIALGTQGSISANGKFVSYFVRVENQNRVYVRERTSSGTVHRFMSPPSPFGEPMYTGGWSADSRYLFYLRSPEGQSTICRVDTTNWTETVVRTVDGQLTGYENLMDWPTYREIWAGNAGLLPSGNSGLWQDPTTLTDGNSGNYYNPRLYPPSDIEIILFNLQHTPRGSMRLYMMTNANARVRTLVMIPKQPGWAWDRPAVGRGAFADNYRIVCSDGTQCYFVPF